VDSAADVHVWLANRGDAASAVVARTWGNAAPSVSAGDAGKARPALAERAD